VAVVTPGEPFCVPTGNARWHLTGWTMDECERYNRRTMQAKRVRADHAAQLSRQEQPGTPLIAVAEDLREYR
jgi:hypothetical protein